MSQLLVAVALPNNDVQAYEEIRSLGWHLSPAAEFAEFKARVVAILEDWFQAIQSGIAQFRYPDPRFQRSNSKLPYSDEDIDRIIAAIDEEEDGEIERNKAHWTAKGIQIGSGFSRLASLQRRALVEELARVVSSYAARLAEHSPVDHEQEFIHFRSRPSVVS